MYQFRENCNLTQFFWWEKKLIENLNWASLPKSSKAVFPVIACHANKQGVAFPGEQTVAILAGVSNKVAREGIRGFEGFPGFEWDYYLTKRGKRSKRFKVKIPSVNNNGDAFPFYKFILEAGLWREIKPSAKALYPVMRHFGFFDFDVYSDLEDDDCDFDEVFARREYDICEAEISVLAKYAGIHRNSIKLALENLESNFLIEPIVECHGWKVFLRSKDNTIFRRDYLNDMIIHSYRHIL